MNKQKNKRWSWVLVLLSLGLLLLFVSYWNVQEYAKAKDQLATDIRYELGTAYNEVKDSYIKDDIFLFLDNKAINDSLFTNFDSIAITISDVTSNTQDEGRYRNIGLNSFPKKITVDSSFRAITVKKDDKDSTFYKNMVSSNGSRLRLIQNENGNLIWSSIDTLDQKKRFKFPEMHKSTDHVFNSIFSSTIERDKETYALFDKKLSAKNLPSKYTVESPNNTKSDGFKIAYESTTFGFSKWEINLSEYKSYLLKKILPNILFSLLLLGIVGLAFWTLIKNWIKQQHLVKTKSEFINNMTHELKTPLATIGVALESISGFDPVEDADKTKEYIAISRNEVTRLSLLVDKVLNIAQFDSETPNLKMETIELTPILEKIESSVKVTMNSKNAEFHTNVDDNLLIHGDRMHLSNVIYNIVDNALKYSGDRPIIFINAQQIDNIVKLSISDNGNGISEEHLKYIFTRFYRISTQDKHDVKGHGLGLSYVKEIVKLHGGTISVNSTIGKGSIFTIELPTTSHQPT